MINLDWVNLDSGLRTKLSKGTKKDAHLCYSTYSVPHSWANSHARTQRSTLLCWLWFQMPFLV